MTKLGLILVAIPFLVAGYAYIVYPAVLWIATRRRGSAPRPDAEEEVVDWPLISICLAAYNEEAVIAGAIEALLSADYPRERREIVIVSDASSDRTDEIVESFSQDGVKLVRLEARGGKTAAENAAAPTLAGSIVVNTDASIRILPDALKTLVAAFRDDRVGVASGRDISVSDAAGGFDRGESGYVGYEMWVRSLETKLGGIVGASGSLYALRRELHVPEVPEQLSRDFASALRAREAGLRAVSVDEAACLVPRTSSLRRELKRKRRTMARGLDTLWHWRHLLNPLRHGWFAIKLQSHKLLRWLVYLTAPLAGLGVLLWAFSLGFAVQAVLVGVALVILAIAGLRWPGRRTPALLGLLAFTVGTVIAGLAAWSQLFTRQHRAVWEPTRRSEA